MKVITVARKPLAGTVALTALTYGTGGFNIEASRIEADNRPFRVGDYKETQSSVYAGRMAPGTGFEGGSRAVGTTDQGRWPANVVLQHHPDCTDAGCVAGCAAMGMDEQSGVCTSGMVKPGYMKNSSRQPSGGGFEGGFQDIPLTGYGDSGGASRFFKLVGARE